MNRLDKVIVFKSLTSSDLNAILDIELNAVQNRVLALGPASSFSTSHAGQNNFS